MCDERAIELVPEVVIASVADRADGQDETVLRECLGQHVRDAPAARRILKTVDASHLVG